MHIALRFSHAQNQLKEMKKPQNENLLVGKISENLHKNRDFQFFIVVLLICIWFLLFFFRRSNNYKNVFAYAFFRWEVSASV